MKTLRHVLLLSLGMVLVLGACGPSARDAAPTLGPDAIFTSAAQTFEAQMATQAALQPPTNTPPPPASPTPLPTFAAVAPLAPISFLTPTPLVGGSSNCDNAAYLADVTIPDGTVMSPGQRFTKTWRMYNSGTCAWSTSYKLVYSGGDAMGGSSAFVPLVVPVGNQTDISVDLTAPDKSGSYKGNWQLQNDKNQPFGSIVFVKIQVGANASVGCSSPSTSGSVTISGTVGSDNVKVNFDGTKGGTGSVTSDSSGSYSITVPTGWSGTITPSKKAHQFSPPSLTFSNVNCDLSGNNFTYN